jgi:caa(3)-type oxidase, subunit IV
MPFALLTKIWLALLVLTGITVGCHELRFRISERAGGHERGFGQGASVFFFMHLKYENRTLGIFLLLVFVILAIFIGFTFFDVAMRPQVVS